MTDDAQPSSNGPREPPPQLRDLFAQLIAIPWPQVEQLNENVERAIQLLRYATQPGAPNDPSRADSYVPWAWLIREIAKSSTPIAVRIAREWYAHLHGHDVQVGAFSKSRGIAAYAAGSLDLQRGNVAAARRWLHLAALEDSRHGHRGAARTVLMASLAETSDVLDGLEAVTRSAPIAPEKLGAQAEYILTKWYLSQDIRRSDQSLDAEHAVNPHVLSLFIDHILAPFDTTKAQGDALEELAAYLLTHVVGCFPVRGVTTPDFENDLVVRNLSRNVSPALDVLGRYFVAECKNWTSPVGSSQLAYFANRIRYCRASFGILFARKGITGGGERQLADARFMLHRAYSHDGVVLAVITLEDLRSIAAQTETVLQLLLRKHDEVRFGTRVIA
ncbi:hypothetical protein WMF26_06910 [Sorangium sp. So ce185]|uniref:hypothetical protein n=1 Tax=Sorangium sp. So ce185 TaxID=3133287 RepID=UPI003F610D12